MLNRILTPGLFITATDTGVGKTVIAAAIARWFADRGKRVGVCKIAATGCTRIAGNLVSDDAVMLAHHCASTLPLELICPIRYAEPLAPAVAAECAGIPLNWLLLQKSLDTLASQSDLMIVEGVGGVMVPMDDRCTVLDVIRWLRLPVVVVARPGLGTINHTLLTVSALRSAEAHVAGVVMNRYPSSSSDVSIASNRSAIEKWGDVPVLAIVPDQSICSLDLPQEILASVDSVDWSKFIRSGSGKPMAQVDEDFR